MYYLWYTRSKGSNKNTENGKARSVDKIKSNMLLQETDANQTGAPNAPSPGIFYSITF